MYQLLNKTKIPVTAATNAALTAFLLAAPGLGGPLPLAACLPALLDGGWERGAAALGAGAGYLLLWGWADGVEPLALTVLVLTAAVLFRREPLPAPALCAGLTFAVGAVFLLDVGLSVWTLLLLTLRTGLAGAAPWAFRRVTRAPLVRPAAPSARVPPLRRAAQAFTGMYDVLSAAPGVVTDSELAGVYDFAAEQVCRCCVRAERCWEQSAEDTYCDLVSAGARIMQRGTALREDLPERFVSRCCHTEGFLTAVNQALDERLALRRSGRRMEESRRVAAAQYLFVARLLDRLGEPEERPRLCYAPELAVGTACRTGSEVSGDRGATCKDGRGNFFVLLCDGMGSGPEARQESDWAARTLTALLEAGAAPDAAMEQLNDLYFLRGSTVFATMDLLALSLVSGEGTLYKWGAAPSYLRIGERVEKIGTASPPPGCDVGSARRPGQYPLSLREGETLIMVSDGADGEETERRLTEFRAGSVRDLASCLIPAGEEEVADDRTAVVLRLRGNGQNHRDSPSRDLVA